MAEVGKHFVVPESVLKKQKRTEEWALAKSKDLEDAKKKKAETRKLICMKTRDYAKEYEEQEKELIQLKREARLKGGFYVESRGYAFVHCQNSWIFIGVFLKVNKATIELAAQSRALCYLRLP